MRRRPLLIGIAVAALAVSVACVLVVLDARWYLSCRVNGAVLQGIDCLQVTSIPKTRSEPARTLGFVPLAIAWWLATCALAGCAVAPMVARYRRRGRAAGSPAG
jgi:hypothetical protein